MDLRFPQRTVLVWGVLATGVAHAQSLDPRCLVELARLGAAVPREPRSSRSVTQSKENPDLRNPKDFMDNLLSALRMPAELPLAPGAKTNFDKDSPFWGFKRYSDVYLDLNSSEYQDVDRIAEEISQGNVAKKNEIVAKINHHKKTSADPMSLTKLLPNIALETNQTTTRARNCIEAAMLWDNDHRTGDMPSPGYQENASMREVMKELSTNYVEVKPGETIPFGALVTFGIHDGAFVKHMARFVGNSDEGPIIWNKPSSYAEDPITFEPLLNAISYEANTHHFSVKFYRYLGPTPELDAKHSTPANIKAHKNR